MPRKAPRVAMYGGCKRAAYEAPCLEGAGMWCGGRSDFFFKRIPVPVRESILGRKYGSCLWALFDFMLLPAKIRFSPSPSLFAVEG